MVGGLIGLAEAIETVDVTTTVQTCIVRLIRRNLDYVSFRDRKMTAATVADPHGGIGQRGRGGRGALEASAWNANRPSRSPGVASGCT